MPPAAPQSSARIPGWAWLTAVGVVVGLVVAPAASNAFDMDQCWVPWAAATDGWRPWGAYRIAFCIYPPVVLYVLTAVRRAQLWAGLPASGGAGLVAMKLPGLLAYAAGAWLCAAGLAPAWGRRAARAAAAATALCLPVWYDAAVWAQWDAILCLALVAAVVAAVRDRPALAWAALGVGLAVKLQAIVLLPTLAVYTLRRWGVRGAAAGVGGLAAGWGIALAPMLLGGSLGAAGIHRAYAAPVDFYRYRTALAFNVWMVGETATQAARQWTYTFGHADDTAVLGPITAKQLGLALLAADAAIILAGLWRRPTADRFVLAAGLLAFGFFMLPTQMHERYVIPACALLAVAAGRGWWKTYLAVMVPALLNQAIALAYENGTTGHARVTMDDIAPYQPWFLAVSVVNVAAFAGVMVGYVRGAFGKAADRAGATLGSTVRTPAM